MHAGARGRAHHPCTTARRRIRHGRRRSRRLRVVTTGAWDPLEGAWASRSAASGGHPRDPAPARGAAAAPRSAPPWPSTPGCGAGTWSPAPAPRRRRARLLLRRRRLPRPRRPSARLRSGGPGRRHPRTRRPRPGPRCPGAALLLPVGPRLRRDRGRRGGRAAARWCGWSGWGCRWARSPATPHGRAWFFVAPGAAAELPELLYRMGWDDADLDLRGLGPGDTSPPRPPTAAASARCAGCARRRWTRRRSPPQARLLLGTLAYVCHRSPA